MKYINLGTIKRIVRNQEQKNNGLSTGITPLWDQGLGAQYQEWKQKQELKQVGIKFV